VRSIGIEPSLRTSVLFVAMSNEGCEPGTDPMDAARLEAEETTGA
jgi:hypothetical protein